MSDYNIDPMSINPQANGEKILDQLRFYSAITPLIREKQEQSNTELLYEMEMRGVVVRFENGVLLLTKEELARFPVTTTKDDHLSHLLGIPVRIIDAD